MFHLLRSSYDKRVTGSNPDIRHGYKTKNVPSFQKKDVNENTAMIIK